jgi:uncharacterized protein DUF6766
VIEMDDVTIAVTIVVLLGTAGLLIVAMIVSIRKERRRLGVRRIWSNFGLSVAFCGLFLISWIGHGLTAWSSYRDEQHAHGAEATASGYVIEFGRSTLENWQSEFLQLFSFVVFSALLIHRGSGESKDGEERIEEALARIEKRLDDIQGTDGVERSGD